MSFILTLIDMAVSVHMWAISSNIGAREEFHLFDGEEDGEYMEISKKYRRRTIFRLKYYLTDSFHEYLRNCYKIGTIVFNMPSAVKWIQFQLASNISNKLTK